MGDRHDVTIIGGGVSGAGTAIHLMELAAASGARLDTVRIIEKDQRTLGGGLAFSSVHASPYHETNIPADRLSIFPDRPMDFVSWWVDRTVNDALPASLSDAVPNPYAVAPRPLVQHYMKDTLNDMAAEAAAAAGTKLELVEDEITAIADRDGHARLVGRKGDYETGRAVLATGNLPARLPGFIDRNLLSHPQFIADQWSENGRSAIGAIGRDDEVVILGSGLSAYDAMRSLKRTGHVGHATMVSRHAFEHFAYPANVRPADQMLDLAPRFLDMEGDAGDLAIQAAQEFYRHTGTRIDPYEGEKLPVPFWHQGLLGRLFGRSAGNVSSEAVLSVWEKQLPRLTERFGPKAVGEMIRAHGALLNTLRVGAGHSISQEMAVLKREGFLDVVAADIDDVYREGGRTIISGATDFDDLELEADFVIASLGPNTNYAKSGSPLWHHVMAAGYTTPHATGIGVTVEADGRLPNAANIYAAGIPTAGHRMITQGIMGPPAYSIPGMRQSIANTAHAVLRSLNI